MVDGNDAEAVYAVATDGARAGPRRRRAVAHRGPHLPPRRPLPRRPGQVPAGRRGRGVEGARPDPGAAGAARRGRRGRRPRARRDRAEVAAKVEAAEQEAGRRRSRRAEVLETQVWADGGSAWRDEGPSMAELTYRQAVAAGIAQEMERDPSVVLIGEDVGAAGRRVQADRGPVRAVRPGAGPRHADQRAGDRRRGDGCRDDRPAPDRRADVLATSSP